MIEDPALQLPAPPRPPAPVPEPRGPLVRAAPADGDPVVCGARRVLVRASGLHGILVAEADGAPLVGRVALGAPPAANLLATPRSLTREIAAAGGSVREVLLVPERLPGFVVQWTGWSPTEGWPLTVELLAGPEGRVRHEGATLRVADAEGGGVVLHLAGASDAAWQVVEAGGRPAARITVRPGPEAPVTLLVDRVEAGQRLPSLPALAALAAHRTRDDLEPDEAPGIRLGTGVPDLDQGVGWARAGLRGLFEDGRAGVGVRILDALSEGGGAAPPGSEAAVVAMGALAAGEWDVARAAVDREPMTAADAEALALWVAWTSRPDPFTTHLDALLSRADAFPGRVRAMLADAAEAVGENDAAGALRTPAARPGPGGRRLPTVGTAAPDGADAQGAAPLEAYLRGDDDDGFARLRPLLARLVRVGPDPGALEAAGAVDGLVRGLFGVLPDAGYGRVTVAPRLPGHWTRVELSGMRLGDATVGVAMERGDGEVIWRLRQTAGGAPVTWIFEPRVAMTRIDAVTVDGQPAEVDVRAVPGGSVLPVQLPAKRERVVVVRGGPAGPG